MDVSFPAFKKTADDWLQIFSQAEPPKESDDVIITRLHNYFTQAIDHPVWQDWRTNAAKDYRFREGDHWTKAELAELAERGQPPTVQNEVKPIIDRVHGQFLMTRQTTTFIAQNSPADDPVANLQADLLRYTDQKTGYEFHESAVALDGLTGGFGVLEVGWKYDNDGYRCIYQRRENPFHMYPDPFSVEPDWSDAKCIQRAKWLDVEDAIALWPDKESDLRAFMHGYEYELSVDPGMLNDANSLYLDRARKRIRPVETWYKRKVKRFVVLTKDGALTYTTPLLKETAGKVLKLMPKGTVVTEPMYVDQMWLGVHIGALLIHHDRSPYKHTRFPFVPLFADRKNNGEPFGLARNIVPINEAIDKRKSKALNMLSNRRIIAEKGALADPENASTQNAKADGYIEVENGALSGGRILFPDNQDIGQAQVMLLQDDKATMPRVSGISDESLGMRTEVRSGAGIARKQAMTSLITNPVVQNLRRFRFERTKLVYELGKEVYTEEMAFQVTDDPNSVRLIQLTKSAIATIKEKKYDLVITDSPDYTTVREQELEMVMQTLPQIATLGPGFGKFVLELTNLRNKKGLQAMLDQMSQPPPPPPPKIALSMKWEELQPEEKAYVALQAFQDPEFAKILAGKNADPAFLAKIKGSLAETQIKEGTRAQVERGKVDLSAMMTAMEGMQYRRELDQTDRDLDQYDRELDQVDQQMQIDQQMGAAGGDSNSL